MSSSFDRFLSSICRDLSDQKVEKVKQRALNDLERLNPTPKEISKHGLIGILEPLKRDRKLGRMANKLEREFRSRIQPREERYEDRAMEEDMDIELPEITPPPFPAVGYLPLPPAYPPILNPQRPSLLPPFIGFVSFPPSPVRISPQIPTPPPANHRRYGKWETLDERIDEFLLENPHIAAMMRLPAKKDASDSGISSPESL
ncbi:hypothetical protein L596_028860 [Steinernema carpocapsae]|uniref:Uncharacterized protein n=1 Tax=Steinernema carpocapsae TaxID=34508 RepID=A0A4U5LZL0_STECR|nr:hypothetical protein L596_028860 [Steinernema carpocapsae]